MEFPPRRFTISASRRCSTSSHGGLRRSRRVAGRRRLRGFDRRGGVDRAACQPRSALGLTALVALRARRTSRRSPREAVRGLPVLGTSPAPERTDPRRTLRLFSGAASQSTPRAPRRAHAPESLPLAVEFTEGALVFTAVRYLKPRRSKSRTAAPHEASRFTTPRPSGLRAPWRPFPRVRPARTAASTPLRTGAARPCRRCRRLGVRAGRSTSCPWPT